MIETTLLNWLSARLDQPVYMEIPEEPPACFYLLERTGGRRENQIAYATIALQSYGDSLATAAVMNARGVNTMLGAYALDSVSDVSLNSDYNFPDLTRKRHRYQAVFDVTHYEME